MVGLQTCLGEEQIVVLLVRIVMEVCLDLVLIV